MEERINQASALSTTLSACRIKSIGLLLLKINSDMVSAHNPTILARTPYDFYGGGNYEVVGTLHYIVRSLYRIDRLVIEIDNNM
jgi:hypothetical protein